MKKMRKILGTTLIMLLALSTSLMAVDYYVDPSGTDDGSHGSGTGSNAWQTIEYAVENVSDPTTATIVIHVAAGTYTLGGNTITVSEDFTDLTIDGAGAGQTIIEGQDTELTGQGSGYGFNIGISETVELKNMTIRRWQRGIQIGSSSNVIIRNCRITGNNSGGDGGPAIRTNTYSGSITLRMENCTVDNNNTTMDAALSTSANVTTYLTNCTFDNNTAGSGRIGGAIHIYSGDLYVTNCTITNNSSGYGGGICVWNAAGGTVLYIKNSIVANNSASYGGDDIYNYSSATIYDAGYNIVENSNYTFNATGDITGNQSNLFGTGQSATPSLAMNNSINGTETLATLEGSVAIDAGNNASHSGQDVMYPHMINGELIETVL